MLEDPDFQWGGGKNSYSTDAVQIIKITGAVGKTAIWWSDPQDTTLDAIVFVKWAGTLVVRKEGSAPINEKDGIIILDNKERDKYKENPFEDTGVDIGKTYYYGLFPYTDQGVFNYSAENITKVLISSVNPIFSENTWDQIIFACQNRDIPETWNIGDEKDMEDFTYYFNGQNLSQTVTFQIWGKNIDDYADGSGKAPLTFGCKDMAPFGTRPMGYEDNQGYDGWGKSEVRRMLEIEIEYLPKLMKDALKKVKTQWYYKNGSIGTSEDLLFIPALSNLTDEYGRYDGDTLQYQIFTDDASRKKYVQSGYYWWTRTAYTQSLYKAVNENGHITSDSCKSPNFMCFAFCF